MHCTRLAPELSATSSIDRGWIMASRCAAQDLADPPALLPRQGAGLLDQHTVPDPARVGLVVRLQLLRRPDDALVARMAVHALDPDHARLLHRVAHHNPFPSLALTHAATPSSRGAPCRPARDPSGPGRGGAGSWPPPPPPRSAE